ncbi:hypothetical protein Ccar_16655 [Clostridium carboxidivorans P7]|uniref:hypothetical protein n=1 Tax=Clostridium carboxidivorans TaxID=217159 RepID=UPI00064FCD58|nr:hypothetical protein [Clostridium carboxidivorans]AKN32402.1 hypothetical protein Ccar_16655 [Clostridium carboxidivorans P7]
MKKKKENGIYVECPLTQCLKNKEGFCKTDILNNDICMDNPLNNLESNTTIIMHNHKSGKSGRKTLTNLEELQIMKIFKDIKFENMEV